MGGPTWAGGASRRDAVLRHEEVHLIGLQRATLLVAKTLHDVASRYAVARAQRNDATALRQCAGRTRKVPQTARQRDTARAGPLGIRPALQVDLQGGVGGAEAAQLHQRGGAIGDAAGMHLDERVVVQELTFLEPQKTNSLDKSRLFAAGGGCRWTSLDGSLEERVAAVSGA